MWRRLSPAVPMVLPMYRLHAELTSRGPQLVHLRPAIMTVCQEDPSLKEALTAQLLLTKQEHNLWTLLRLGRSAAFTKVSSLAQAGTLVRQRGARMLTAITPTEAQMMMANTAVTKISLPQAFHWASLCAASIRLRGASARAACVYTSAVSQL